MYFENTLNRTAAREATLHRCTSMMNVSSENERTHMKHMKSKCNIWKGMWGAERQWLVWHGAENHCRTFETKRKNISVEARGYKAAIDWKKRSAVYKKTRAEVVRAVFDTNYNVFRFSHLCNYACHLEVLILWCCCHFKTFGGWIYLFIYLHEHVMNNFSQFFLHVVCYRAPLSFDEKWCVIVWSCDYFCNS